MKFHHTIKKTQPVMMRKRKMTSGREFIYRHHVVPRVKLYVPKEEPFPVPLKYIDVTRTTHTSLDVLWEKQYWRLLERGWRKRIIWCMDRGSQDSSFWTKGHLMGTHGPSGDWQENKQPLVQMMHGQICGSKCLMQRRRKQNKNGLSRNQSSTIPDNWEEHTSSNQTMKSSSSQRKPLGESWKFRCQQQCLAKYR